MRFGRYYELAIGLGDRAVQIKPPINIVFSCDKSISGGLNKLNIKIYNLKEDSRNKLVKDTDSATYIPIQLKIGYNNKADLIFKGNVQTGSTTKEGVNYISNLECYDGGFTYSTASISTTAKSNQVITNSLLKSLKGLDIGLINKKFSYLRPKVLCGNPLDILKNVLDSDEEIFIDNERIYILNKNQVVGTYTPLVNAKSGLLNIPQRQQRVTSFITVINPTLRLGGLFSLVSKNAKFVNGVYKMISCNYTGEYVGNDWKQSVTGLLQGEYNRL